MAKQIPVKYLRGYLDSHSFFLYGGEFVSIAISLRVAFCGDVPAWLFLRGYSWYFLLFAWLPVAISAWLCICGLPARGAQKTTHSEEYA